MRVVDPGHKFTLTHLDTPADDPSFSTLVFVKREGHGYPGNEGHHPGTNLQEVLRACISRLKYVDKQISHPCNILTILNLRQALLLLEQRAAERHGRDFWYDIEDTSKTPIEELAVCQLCGHIGCQGTCHSKH